MRRQVVRGAVRAATAVAVVGALLGGCGTGPSQVGSAFIVGAVSVPVVEVQARLDQTFARQDLIAQLAAQGIGAPEIARDLVTQAVLHELSVRAANAESVAVTPADIDGELLLQGGLDVVLEQWPFGEALLRERIGDELIAQQLGAKYVNGLSVTADILGVASEEEAESAARVLAVGGPPAEALFTDPDTSVQGFEYRASANPDVAASAVFGTPVGGTGYFQPLPGEDNWIAFRVLDRRTDAPAVPVELDLVAQIGKSGLAKIGIRILQPVAAEAGVRVNPRYGVWDPVTLRVLEKDQVTGAVLAPVAR